jgi:hypothetical protein
MTTFHLGPAIRGQLTALAFLALGTLVVLIAVAQGFAAGGRELAPWFRALEGAAGLALLLAGAGLWRRCRWAWRLTMVLSVLIALLAAYGLVWPWMAPAGTNLHGYGYIMMNLIGLGVAAVASIANLMSPSFREYLLPPERRPA